MTTQRDSRNSRDTRETAKRAVKIAKTLGPLYVDPKHLQTGFRHVFVDGTTPGVMTYYEKLGYEVVKDESLKVGDQNASTSSRHGSAVTVTSKCGTELVLMKIDEELALAIDEELLKDHKALIDKLQNPEQIDDQDLIGNISFKR